MALILIEGFSDDSLGNWDAGSSIDSLYTSSPRVPGGRYARMRYTDVLAKSFAASSMVVVGFGLRPPSGDEFEMSFYGDDAATQHITIVRNVSTALLEIRRGSLSGTLLATGTTPLNTGRWHYVEVSATISDTVGEVHVRLNGSGVDEVSYTGDTKNGGTNDSIDRVRFPDAYTAEFYLSDMYILNDSGSTNNTFLGDVAVRALAPTGNGNSSQLTGSDADQTDNYVHVDEMPYSTTDYVGSNTTGNKDTYAMADLPANTASVLGVRVTGMMYKSDAGYAQSRLLLRSGGTDYTADTEVLSTSAMQYQKLYEQDPATAATWTVSGVNSAEAGMEVM